MHRSRLRCLVGVLGVLGFLGVHTSVVASPHWRAPFYELGLHQTSGGLTLRDGTSVSGTGLRLYEHSGFITPLTLGLPAGLVLMLSIQDRKVTGVTKVYGGQDSFETRQECSGTGSMYACKEVVVRNKRQLTDIVVESVPLPPEVVAAQQAAADDALGRILALSAHFDLTYFPNRDDGSLSGTRVTWYVFTWRAKIFELATGYHYARLRADVTNEAGTMVAYRRRAHAIPLMLTVRPAPWIYGSVEYEGNLLGLGKAGTGGDAAPDHSSTVRASITLGMPRRVPWLHRLYVRGGVERNRPTAGGGWGSFLEGGLRF